MRPSSQIPFLMSLLPFTDIQSWLSSVIVLHLLSIEKEGEEGGGSKKRNGGHEGERRGIKEGCGWERNGKEENIPSYLWLKFLILVLLNPIAGHRG